MYVYEIVIFFLLLHADYSGNLSKGEGGERQRQLSLGFFFLSIRSQVLKKLIHKLSQKCLNLVLSRETFITKMATGHMQIYCEPTPLRDTTQVQVVTASTKLNQCFKQRKRLERRDITMLSSSLVTFLKPSDQGSNWYSFYKRLPCFPL